MSTLEHEIIEKFHRLQPAAQQRIRELIDQELASELEQADSSEFDYAAWFRNVEALRQQIRASHGDQLPTIEVVGILRAIRDGEDE